MDNTDIKLLHILAKEADISASSLVPQLNLSVPAINKRISKLRSENVIEQTTIITNPEKVDKQITAFVLVVLEHFNQSQDLLDIVSSETDVLECYAVSGEYDYLLKICAKDIDALENNLLKLKEHGIAKSQTMFTLRKHKYTPTVLPDYK